MHRASHPEVPAGDRDKIYIRAPEGPQRIGVALREGGVNGLMVRFRVKESSEEE